MCKAPEAGCFCAVSEHRGCRLHDAARLQARPRPLPAFSSLQVRFDADAAKALHEGLYRQKLATLLEKKKLSDEDDAGEEASGGLCGILL